MPKNSNLSGKRNFMITMSKQTNGSNGFMPSRKNHQHRNLWYLVIGIIVVIVLFIFGKNLLASHQSKKPVAHHTKVTRVVKRKPSRKAKSRSKQNNDAKQRSRSLQRKINKRNATLNRARSASNSANSSSVRGNVKTTINSKR